MTTASLEAQGVLIFEGAEARLFLVPFLSRAFCLLKHRRPRPYVHPTLDRQLQRQRLQQEVRAMLRCRKAGVDVPHILRVEEAPPQGPLEPSGGAPLVDAALAAPPLVGDRTSTLLPEDAGDAYFLDRAQESCCSEAERHRIIEGAFPR
ncbi:hypothetical protein cyc_08157 [Cyclospora cayetanensis]|uniref:non-specific serine/threonine protein kinase n=1 Tax=Cyclospora cayetanensis TaxID=88456 RepID=A0A1D3D7T6_9EIME|nr:hypothetical protein cyc_08157 [Cyclospora cayetanensis]